MTILNSNVNASLTIGTRIQIQTTAEKSNLREIEKKSSFESSSYRKFEANNHK